MHRVSALSRERSSRRASSYEPNEADLARLSVLQREGAPSDFSGNSSDVSAESMSPPLSPMVSDASSATSPEPRSPLDPSAMQPIEPNQDDESLVKFQELISKREKFTTSKHRRIGRSLPNIPLTFDSHEFCERMHGCFAEEDDSEITVSRTVSGNAATENCFPRSRRSSKAFVDSHAHACPPCAMSNGIESATLPSSQQGSVGATPVRPKRRNAAPAPPRVEQQVSGGGAENKSAHYSMRSAFPSIPTASDLAQLESDISATLQRGKPRSSSSHRSADRARSLSPPVRHRHHTHSHGDSTTDDDRQWLEEKLKQGLANMATELRKLIQSIELDNSLANSMSTTPTMLSPKMSNSSNEDVEEGIASESPSLLRTVVDGTGTPSRMLHMQESSVINKKVQGLCAKLLDAWEQGTLRSSDFRSATSSLAKLLEHNAPEHAARNIKSILMQIATPARLMECKEHQDMMDDDHLPRDMERIWELTTDSLHMPRYIQEKMTTHFGMSGVGGRRSRSVEGNGAEGLVMKQSKAQFLESLAEGEKPCRNDFDLVKQISAGAYGSVFIGVHKVTKEQFAIKVMKKKQMLAKNCASQVFAEKEVLKFAQNPFVVQFYCSFSTPQSLYIVMEHAAGGDLAALLKNLGQLTERESRRYFAETVLAVEYIHEYGIVHRDLKPDNLIIAHNGHIKLTDFGLSKIGLMKRTTRWIDDDAPAWTAAKVRDRGADDTTDVPTDARASTDSAPTSEDMDGKDTTGDDEVHGVFGDLEYESDGSGPADAVHAATVDANLVCHHPAVDALVTSPADSRRGSGMAVGASGAEPPSAHDSAVCSSSRAVSDDALTAGETSSGDCSRPRSSGSSVVTPPLSPAPAPLHATLGDAEEHDRRGSSGAMFGTPDYIAPEVILAHGYDASVDWWSMGIILYELVCGVPPFTGGTPKEIFEKVVRDPVVWPNDDEFDVPPSHNLRDLVGQLLEKDPDARIGSVKADSAFAFNEETFEIKGHPFFEMALDDDVGGVDLIDWERLLEEQACFVPQLEDDKDTTYFDLRNDRYDRNDLSSSEGSDSDDETSSVHTDHSSLGMFRNFSCVNLFQSPSPMRSRSRSPATITLPEPVAETTSGDDMLQPPLDAPDSTSDATDEPQSPVPERTAARVEEVLSDGHSLSDRDTPETPSSVDTDVSMPPPAHMQPTRSAAIPLHILADTAPDSDTLSEGGHSSVSGASSPVLVPSANALGDAPAVGAPITGASPTATPTPLRPNDPTPSAQPTPKQRGLLAKTRLIRRVSDERRDTRSAPVSIPVQQLQANPTRSIAMGAPTTHARSVRPGDTGAQKKRQQSHLAQIPAARSAPDQQPKQLTRAQHQQMLVRQQQHHQHPQRTRSQQQQQQQPQQQQRAQQQQRPRRVQTAPSAQQRRQHSGVARPGTSPRDMLHSPPRSANADVTASSPLVRSANTSPVKSASGGSSHVPKRSQGRSARRPTCPVGNTSRCTHLCVNWSLTFGFGFNIDTRNGMHRVSNIDRGGPAEVAGIRAGYEIIGVNHTNIVGWTRYKVARFVKTIGGQDNIGRQVVFHCIRIKTEADKKKSASSKQKTKTKQTWDWLSRITTRSPARSPARSPIVSPTSDAQVPPGTDHSASHELVRGLGPNAQHPRGSAVAPPPRTTESRPRNAMSPPAQRARSGKSTGPTARSPPPPSAVGVAGKKSGGRAAPPPSQAAPQAPTPESPTRGFWKVGRSSSLRGTRSTTATYDGKPSTPSPVAAGGARPDSPAVATAAATTASSPPGKAPSPSSPLVFASNPLMRMSPSRASPVPASPLRHADSPRRPGGHVPLSAPAAPSSPTADARAPALVQQAQVRRQSVPLIAPGGTAGAAAATGTASVGGSPPGARAASGSRRTRSKSLRSVGNSPLGTSPTGTVPQHGAGSLIESSASPSMESLSDLGTSPPPADADTTALSASFKDRPPPVFELDAESEISSMASAMATCTGASPPARQTSGLHTIVVSESSPSTATEDLTFELILDNEATRVMSTDSGYLDQQAKPLDQQAKP
eukprot:m.1295439 g.1295439  ORF g.1295439 m.1295439 type:complete len:2032 (+) comp24790_c0_seq1:370-6465(+)